MNKKKPVYPFVAIVGQDKMKLALILNIINPGLSGVLIRGEKGTAKSTAVRALADILPEINVIRDCPFQLSPDDEYEIYLEIIRGMDLTADVPAEKPETESRKVKVVELPVGATEDRVVGSLDLEHALKKGEKRVEPGLLAAAHRGVLYVDEVNLLDDHVVDVLLDSAAMGVNSIEREGVSFSHPARFTLVGTMNPEEGELRPQLLDRFGLCVKVEGLSDPALRREVVTRRLEFDADPEAFCEKWSGSGEDLADRIKEAMGVLNSIELPDDALDRAVNICLLLGVDGHRGDLTVIKTACTLAAFEGRGRVEFSDIDRAAELALPHRVRRRPFQEVEFGILERLEGLKEKLTG